MPHIQTSADSETAPEARQILDEIQQATGRQPNLFRAYAHHAYPNWPVNRWITAMFRLYRHEIVALLRHRDEVIEQWSREHEGVDTFEDRDLEITGFIPVAVEDQLEDIRRVLDSR